MAHRHRATASMLLGKFTARHHQGCQASLSAVGQVSFSTTIRATTTSDNNTSSLLSLIRDNKTWFLTSTADKLLRKKNVKHIPKQEWVQVCQKLDLDTKSAELPNGNINCGKLRNKVKEAQHVNIKSRLDYQQQYKNRRARALLTSKDEIDLYEAHSLVELRLLCQRYGINMKNKKAKEQLVKALVKKKQSVTPREEEILTKYDKELLHYCRELGFQRDVGTRCKLTLARKLLRVQNTTLLIHEKLLQMQHGTDPLDADLSLAGITDFKEQLCFYRDRRKQKRIFQKLGMEYNKKLKCVHFLRKICRRLNIEISKK